MHRAHRLVASLLLACGPATSDDVGATTDDVTTTAGTTGPTPTTGDATTLEPLPPCAAEETHEGDLLLEGASTDRYACVTRVAGYLHVHGDYTEAELRGLTAIREVGGTLRIKDNAVLTSLAPFAALREAADVVLIDLPALVDVSALAGMTKLGSFIAGRTAIANLPAFTAPELGLYELALTDTPALTDLGALAGWTFAADGLALGIEAHPTLTSLASLPPLPLTDLSLTDLPALTSLAGLPPTAIANLTLIDLPALTSLAGLPPTEIDNVMLVDLPALTSLAELEPLRRPGSVTLSGLPAVPDLEPLAGLEYARTLYLNEMPQVTTLAPLANLTSVGTLSIGACIHSGPDDGGMTGLTSLAGLSALTEAEAIGIANSTGLTSLAGAPALTLVEHLQVVGNPGLEQDDYDAFLAQLDPPPPDLCLGNWLKCSCLTPHAP